MVTLDRDCMSILLNAKAQRDQFKPKVHKYFTWLTGLSPQFRELTKSVTPNFPPVRIIKCITTIITKQNKAKVRQTYHTLFL